MPLQRRVPDLMNGRTFHRRETWYQAPFETSRCLEFTLNELLFTHPNELKFGYLQAFRSRILTLLIYRHPPHICRLHIYIFHIFHIFVRAGTTLAGNAGAIGVLGCSSMYTEIFINNRSD